MTQHLWLGEWETVLSVKTTYFWPIQLELWLKKYIFLQSAQVLLQVLKKRDENEDKSLSSKAVYVFSPYSDIFIDFAKILALIGTKQKWSMSLSVYVCTRSGSTMKISLHVK